MNALPSLAVRASSASRAGRGPQHRSTAPSMTDAPPGRRRPDRAPWRAQDPARSPITRPRYVVIKDKMDHGPFSPWSSSNRSPPTPFRSEDGLRDENQRPAAAHRRVGRVRPFAEQSSLVRERRPRRGPSSARPSRPEAGVAKSHRRGERRRRARRCARRSGSSRGAGTTTTTSWSRAIAWQRRDQRRHQGQEGQVGGGPGGGGGRRHRATPAARASRTCSTAPATRSHVGGSRKTSPTSPTRSSPPRSVMPPSSRDAGPDDMKVTRPGGREDGPSGRRDGIDQPAEQRRRRVRRPLRPRPAVAGQREDGLRDD